MPDANTLAEQHDQMQAEIDVLISKLVKAVNMQAIRFYNLSKCRSNRNMKPEETMDAARSYRAAESDTDATLNQMIQAYMTFFTFLDENPDAVPKVEKIGET